tara:strand:- start:63 stop:284 length:222 start_codon:yes stop_codon:yes gene_type:complete
VAKATKEMANAVPVRLVIPMLDGQVLADHLLLQIVVMKNMIGVQEEILMTKILSIKIINQNHVVLVKHYFVSK